MALFGDMVRGGNDKFMNGIIYNVILFKDDSGEYELVKGDAEPDDLITVDSDYFRIMIDGCDWEEDEASRWFLGDVKLKNGESHLLNKTVEAFRKRCEKLVFPMLAEY